ncbi:MAG TPA: hypothetical protein VK694_05815 [Verrucomicrobiae bacterium]|nr:hypothetical protein [Verrucomicrobiae bacterium]
MENSSQSAVFASEDLSPEDRAVVGQAWEFAYHHSDLLASLEPHVLSAVMQLSDEYLREGQYVHLRKLFKNAVPYIAEGKITSAPEGGFFVWGNTNDHHVTVAEDHSMACDCDLFHGRGKFEDNAGDCSHIQTATLFSLAAEQ